MIGPASHVVVVSSDDKLRAELTSALESFPGSVHAVSSMEEGRAAWASHPAKTLFVELRGPEDDRGFELVDLARGREDATVVLVTRAVGSALSLEVLARSGVHLLHPPLDPERVRILAVEAPSPQQNGDGEEDDDRVMESLGGLLGRSDAMQGLFRRLARAAPTSATVLVTGESGTGKELVGRTLHELGERRRGPYVPVNCGAISPTLMESELFGHEKGSFTGAMRQHRGFFERADRGTLLLDEVTEMAIELQVKLLRVLETSQFTRIGGEVPRTVDVRIVAATNRQPEAAVSGGKLREDLLYRLKVIQLHIAPLRNRPEDIALLAPYIAAEVSRREGTSKILPPSTLEALREHDWPGNVRELQNAIYTAYLLSEGAEVEVDALPVETRPRDQGDSGEATVPIRVGSSIRDAERTMILTTLARLEGNKTRTAKALGISLKTLYNRLHSYGYMGKDD